MLNDDVVTMHRRSMRSQTLAVVKLLDGTHLISGLACMRYASGWRCSGNAQVGTNGSLTYLFISTLVLSTAVRHKVMIILIEIWGIEEIRMVWTAVVKSI